MKSRITKKFVSLRKEGKKALIPFITAGDPTLAQTEKIVYALEEAGADIIELGIPFSDPMADGPVIQASYERALKNKITLNDVLGLVKKIRKKSQITLLLMGYYNPIFVMGCAAFAKQAGESGVDAVLIVDLPPEEAGELRGELKKNNVNLVHLLAPTSDAPRITKAVKSGSGFIYYVSLTGVTGATLNVTPEIKNQIGLIRRQTSLPIAVGFGVSTPEHVSRLAPYADGVVVGSALVKIIAAVSGKKDGLSRISRLIAGLKKGF